MSATYPTDRQGCGFFARFAKAIFRSDAIERIGIDAVTLALFVAAKEDGLHYRRAPTIWREEIADRLQLRSPKRVIAARTAAIEAGLIYYSKSYPKSKPVYWALIPDWLSPFFNVPKRNIKPGSRSETEHKAERKAERKAEHIPKDPLPTTHKSARTSSKSTKTFAKPTLEEVTAYCIERRNGIDPQQWYDHYEANGWRVGRNPMRDWRAAVRTWERNGFAAARNGTPEPESIYPDRTAEIAAKRKEREVP